jgi:hypothetical protein
MTTLDKRIESLEKQSTNEGPGVCTVFVGADGDADQNQAQGVAAFIDEHGCKPRRVTVISFVEPSDEVNRVRVNPASERVA